MEKINFENLPSTNVPISADNLNLMQYNVDEAKIEKMVVSKSLDTAGWYRIAKLNGYGKGAISLLLNINTWYSNNNNISHTVAVNITKDKARLTSFAGMSNSEIINKARATLENGIIYIEIYYSANSGNAVGIDIVNQKVWNAYEMSMLDFEAPTDTATVLDELSIGEFTTGKEYATNEFIDGKRVYKKRIDCGALPSAGETKKIAHGLTNFTVVDLRGNAYSSVYGASIPLPYHNIEDIGYSVSLDMGTTYIYLKSTLGQEHYHGYVTIYYTKN